MKRLAIVATSIIFAACLFGCSGASDLGKTVTVGGASISCPESWVEKSLDGGKVVGVSVSEATAVMPSEDGKTVVAIGSAKGEEMSMDDLKTMLADQASLDVENIQMNGKQAIKATGELNGMKIVAMAVEDSGAVSDIAVATIDKTEYQDDESLIDSVIDSVSFK